MAEIATTDLWVGLNSLKQDGFYWTDGKAKKYTNWGYSVSTHNLSLVLNHRLIDINIF